jgi:O-methyltransferase involved in polyketide biosynthesis
LDLADAAGRRELFAQIADTARRVLVVTEGLLVYMLREQVASLASDLCGWPQFRWWLSDLVSRTALEWMEKESARSREPRTVRSDSVRYQFAPEEGLGFFRRLGWETAESRSCVEEGRLLDRWLFAKAIVSAKLSREQADILHNLFTVVKLNRAKTA